VNETLFTLSVWALPVLIAVTLHEAAHGFVAWRLGDPTAKARGRVSFNPLRHVDPFGTVLLPLLLFLSHAPFLLGYAKPVPVNYRNLRHPRRDSALVALAGPATNIGLATLSALLVPAARIIPGAPGEWLVLNLVHSVLINLVLAVFNMLPLPPLDGGRVAVGLLPRSLAQPLARLERYGMLILIGLLLLLPWLARSFGWSVNPFAWLILEPVKVLFRALSWLTGISS